MSQYPTNVIDTFAGGEESRRLAVLQTQLQDLEQRFDFHLGPSFGAVQMNMPHTNMLFPYREIHGPSKQSIDGTHNVTFVVDFDSTVARLHQSKLTVRMSAVRSNVAAASSSAGSSHTHAITPSLTTANGGSQNPTSSSGGSQTPTSAAGSSHTHSVSSATSAATGASPVSVWSAAWASTGGTGHNHASATTDAAVSNEPDTGHAHTVSGGSGTESAHTHSATVAVDATGKFHTHDVSGQTAASEATHTHSVSINAHSHTVTIDAHSHTVNGSISAASEATHTHAITMTYGIYEGPAPATPGVTVTINGTDRTSALGGPWDADFTVDITQYLREQSGDPLRQANAIVLTSAELIDVETVCKSFVSAASPFAAGVPGL